MKQICMALIIVLFSVESKAQEMWFGQGEFFNRSRIVSTTLIDGKLFVEKRESSNVRYPEGGGPSDRVWKEIYCSSNGVIVLERKVEGSVIPPQTSPEKIEWPDAESKNIQKHITWDTNSTLTSTNHITTFTNFVSLSPQYSLITYNPIYSIFGLTFSKNKDGVLVLDMDKDLKMDVVVSNFVNEIKKQLEIK